MSTRVDRIVKTYRSLAQIPTLVGAHIRSNGIISTNWSQRNLERGKSTKFTKDILTSDLLKSDVNYETIPLDISSELLSRESASEKFRAVLRENDNKQYLEIWQDNNNFRTVDLSAPDIHGSVYSDLEFSAFEWSPDEKKILYVAEKKPPKSEPFYKRKGPVSNDHGDEEKTKGEEYLFVQDWGEQLVGKKNTVLVEYHIESDTIEILKGVPDDITVGQPKYSPDGTYIVGVAYDTEPRKYGLIYCTNRSSTVFKLDLEGHFSKLPLKGMAVKSPIFSPDSQKLLWLQRRAGGPHNAGMSLVKTCLPLTENSLPEVVVDIVDTEIETRNKKPFYGLYNSAFAKRPWASKNRLLLNTPQKYSLNSYVVNIDNGDLIQLEYNDGSQQVIDVFNDKVLAIQKNFFRQDRLVLGKLPEPGCEDSISWTQITASETIVGLGNSVYKYLDLTAKGESDSVRTFNAIYVGPKDGEKKSVPLIVWPHGGPHSVIPNMFILEVALFLSFGYAVILVNYRGSIGSGQKSVNFLLGKIGQSDVADCVLATDVALETFPWLNPDSVALTGGSHGGFLVAHLSGQYPDKYKAVVARNPVIDVASMSIISDIPDWCYVESGKEYTQKGEINNEILLAMRKASPIIHAHKVKAPTLLQIGSKDLRVPPYQGTEYHLRLKANGIITRMNLYDDNHPLGAVTNEIDNTVNGLLWIEEHLKVNR